MKPKLRGDTLYVPSPDGTYLMNNQKALALPGKQTYLWIERLAPHLDGSRSIAELTAGLSTDKRDMVISMVRFLVDHGFAKDVADDQPHGLTADEEHAYAAEIAFVDYFVDSAAARFEQFRRSSVIAIGSGRTLAALVHAILHCGVAAVRVMAVDDTPENLKVHQSYAEVSKRRDSRQLLSYEVQPDWTRTYSVRSAMAPYDVIVHVADHPCLARARLLNQICVEDGKVLMQAVIIGDQAWIGPLVAPDHPASCWECGWRRAWPQLSEDPLEFTDRPDALPSEYLTAPPAALVSNHLAFEMFKYLTGAGPLDMSSRMVRLDLETLNSRNHRFPPHPRCTVAHPGRPQADHPARVDEQGFATGVVALFDEMLGVFTQISERDFVQLPLHVSEVVFADPSAAEGDRRIVVHGVGRSVRTARMRATRRACELYAASFDEHPDAARVSAGLASGYSWAEAVSRGMSGQAAALAVAEFAGVTSGDPLPRVRVEAMDDADVARYVRMLNAAGHEFAVYDVTGSLDAPAFAFCSEERTVAWMSDLDVATAIANGLEQVILDFQARSNGQLAYCPEAPALSQSRMGIATVMPPTGGPIGWEQRMFRWSELFASRGLRPVARRIDPDPAVTAVLPYVVDVVLTPEVIRHV